MDGAHFITIAYYFMRLGLDQAGPLSYLYPFWGGRALLLQRGGVWGRRGVCLENALRRHLSGVTTTHVSFRREA